jgi:hypothetical protein
VSSGAGGIRIGYANFFTHTAEFVTEVDLRGEIVKLSRCKVRSSGENRWADTKKESSPKDMRVLLSKNGRLQAGGGQREIRKLIVKAGIDG